MKAKIPGGSPGGSPGGIYGGIFFLTGSWRENTRAGKIPAGSRRGLGFLAGSRQDPGGFFTRELLSAEPLVMAVLVIGRVGAKPDEDTDP